MGTLDQALLPVLPVPHARMILQGITGKVLVVDEVHAFLHIYQTRATALHPLTCAAG